MTAGRGQVNGSCQQVAGSAMNCRLAAASRPTWQPIIQIAATRKIDKNKNKYENKNITQKPRLATASGPTGRATMASPDNDYNLAGSSCAHLQNKQ